MQAHHARLLDKLVTTMTSQPTMYLTPQAQLNVRCVELHSYTAGDGLMVDGHRDQGSIATMSVLLSEPSEYDGGVLTTCARGAETGVANDGATHVEHRIGRGDAVLFHSEKMHNVTPVTRGVRHALVLELWLQPTNVRDRHG